MIPSPSSRRRFADLCSDWSTVGKIAALFDTEGYPSEDEFPNVSGVRRTLALQYFANVDWNDPTQTARIVRVMSEALIDRIADARNRFLDSKAEIPSEIRRFISNLQRDGVGIDDEGQLLPGSVVSSESQSRGAPYSPQRVGGGAGAGPSRPAPDPASCLEDRLRTQ